MRFLLDQNLSPEIRVTADVGEAMETVHVREAGLSQAADDEILDFARSEGFVVISQDTDFTNLIYRQHASMPSLILLREIQEVTAAQISQLISQNLDQILDDLKQGAVVSIMRDRLRVRMLPIGGRGDVGH